MIRLLTISVVLALASSASAQDCLRGECRSPEVRVGQVIYFQYPQRHVVPKTPPAPVHPSPQSPPVAVVPIVPAPAPQVVADPGLAWINAFRASYRLPPLAYDPACASIAASNNIHQRGRGLGHWFRGDRRQNAGYGLSLPTIQASWVASPAHLAALLDRSITCGAVAWDGLYATFSAR